MLHDVNEGPIATSNSPTSYPPITTNQSTCCETLVLCCYSRHGKCRLGVRRIVGEGSIALRIRAVISGSLLLERQLRYLRTLRLGRLGTARSLLVDRLRGRRSDRATPAEGQPAPRLIVRQSCDEHCANLPARPIVETPAKPIDREWPSDWKSSEAEVRVEERSPARVSLDVGHIIDVWW